jgi:tripartite-type tricarboxylate transporter receptor subunit TctC
MKVFRLRPWVATCGLSLVIAAGVVPVPASAADAYPARAVRMIIPFAAGGGADAVARLLGNGLSERLGQPVIADNRSGAGGIIGVEAGARAAPDGQTLTFVPSSFTMQPALRKLPYDPLKSFVPIARVGKGDYVLAINPSVPAKTVKEFIAHAKRNPGKLMFASAGAGSTAHLFIELFKLRAGIDLTVVQFKGGGQQVTDLLGGHTHGAMLSLPAVRPHILSGELRGLATASLERSPAFDGMPTLNESGLPGFEAIVWWGVLAPAGTPVAITSRLEREMKDVLALPETRKAFASQGVEPDFQDGAAFHAFLSKEIAAWTEVVKKAGIELQ